MSIPKRGSLTGVYSLSKPLISSGVVVLSCCLLAQVYEDNRSLYFFSAVHAFSLNLLFSLFESAYLPVFCSDRDCYLRLIFHFTHHHLVIQDSSSAGYIYNHD